MATIVPVPSSSPSTAPQGSVTSSNPVSASRNHATHPRSQPQQIVPATASGHGPSPVTNVPQPRSTTSTNAPAPVAPAAAAAAAPPLDPYSDPVPLTGNTVPQVIYRFPSASLGQEHSARAIQVCDILRQATRTSKVHKYTILPVMKIYLKDYADLITFEPSQCGPSPSQALPSIMVKYPKGFDVRLLKKEFDKAGDTKSQYAPEHGPSFKLYYCPVVRPLTSRWGHFVPTHLEGLDVSESIAKEISLCGQRIECKPATQDHPSSSATFTCMLEIKGECFGLLSAHPFGDTTRQDALLKQLAELDGDGDDGEILDDDQFDDNEHDAGSASVAHVFQVGQSSQGLLLHSDAAAVASSITAQVSSNGPTDVGKSDIIIPGPDDLVDDLMDCDWALKSLKDHAQRLPNLYFRDQDPSRFRHITKVASVPSLTIENKVVVDVITESGVKCGTLLPRFINLPGLSGRSSCNAWMVSMNTSSDIVDGDSGSLVVDANTSQAYGHVVATGPEGIAYVVPLQSTLQQVKAFFGTTDVRLADPLKVLADLAVFYIKERRIHRACASLLTLVDLVQQLCDARKWQQLVHWIETCAARRTLLEASIDKLIAVHAEPNEQVRLFRARLGTMHVLKERLRAEASGSDGTVEIRLTKGLASFLNSIVEHCALEEQGRRGSTSLDQLLSDGRSCRWETRGSDSFLSQGLYKTFLWTILNDPDIGLIRKEVRLRLVWLVWPSLLLRPCVFCRYTFEQVVRNHHRHLECSTCGLYRTEISGLRPHISLALSKRKLIGKGSCANVYLVTVGDFWPATSPKAAGDGFALKEISKRSTPFARWENERLVLRLLQKFNSPHIIRLVHWDLTEDNYRLLFPLAQHNLEQIMNTEPPAIHNLSVWALKQIQGLAAAVARLHSVDNSRTYVRHGDLKPENILWFRNESSTKMNTLVDATIDPTEGTLVIADFGLAEIHSTKSKSKKQGYLTANTDNELVHYRNRADSMYAAPEIEVPLDTRAAARAYDIWSLGCVFLEFVVWMLQGPEARKDLLQDLRPNVPGRSASYWQVDVAAQKLKFSLKASVQSCLQLLLESTTTNTRLRAATETIVYGGLLDPDPYTRMTAEDFGRMLLEIEEANATRQWYISPPSNRCTPVWSRTWVTQYVLWNDHGSWTTSAMFAGEDFSDILTRPAIKDSDIVDEDDAFSQSCDTDWDNSEDDREQAPIKQECPYCKLEPGRSIAIKYHIKAQHRTRQLHECPDCGYLLKDKRSLAEHRQGVGAVQPCPSLFFEHRYCAFKRVSSQVVDNAGRAHFRVDSHHEEDDLSGPGTATSSQTDTRKLNSGQVRTWRSGGCGLGYHEKDDRSGGSSSRDVC